MTEDLELEFQHFQELANVQIIRGGSTVEDKHLFLCTADLVWKVSSAEFSAMMQQEISEEVTSQGDDDMLWRALTSSSPTNSNESENSRAAVP